uniref:FLYWCH-type domain-containing protein n=2 Tax=Meloidogyne TaxID=189290 RepID=A0A6V7TUT0_MELEN|nr:unnamed protein product [Meloidogyne enterolobii]
MNIGEEISDEGEVVSDISEIEEGEIIAGDQQNVMENEYNLEFVEVKSGRGRSLLSRLGFEYYFENESRTMEGVEYWRCVKRSNGYCTGRIHVLAEWRQLNEIRYKLGKIANAAHNHPADPEKQSIRDAIEKLKNLAGMENPLITREAVDQSRLLLIWPHVLMHLQHLLCLELIRGGSEQPEQDSARTSTQQEHEFCLYNNRYFVLRISSILLLPLFCSHSQNNIQNLNG